MITVLMGAPGAGKTTWLKENWDGEFVASTEAIRINREMDRDDFMTTLRAKGQRALQEGEDVIVDGTNTIDRHRLFWLKLAQRLGHNTRLITFEASFEKLIYAQTIRQYPAPYPVVRDHHKRFIRALRSIDKEGWDEIVRMSR